MTTFIMLAHTMSYDISCDSQYLKTLSIWVPMWVSKYCLVICFLVLIISKSCFVAKTVSSSGETWGQKWPDDGNNMTDLTFRQLFMFFYVWKLIWTLGQGRPLIAVFLHHFPVDIAAPTMQSSKFWQPIKTSLQAHYQLNDCKDKKPLHAPELLSQKYCSKMWWFQGLEILQ